jgi:hypothetical protein
MRLKTDNKRTQIYIPANYIEKLKKISYSKGTSMSELIRRILDEWLANNTMK